MDDARLIAALGQEPHTPLDQAVEASLDGLEYFPASVNSLGVSSSVWPRNAPTDACGSLVVLFATASASVRPVQCSFARPSGHENFRLLDRRAAVWLNVARSPERQSLGAPVTCTA